VCGSLVVYYWRKPVVSRILGHNRWPAVLEVLDHDSSPRAFHRAGGRSQSLDSRQNRYSYVIVGAITEFNGEAMGAILCVASSLALFALGGSDPTSGFHLRTLRVAGPSAIMGPFWIRLLYLVM
jgi:hypothetical protein